jgi:hypothetical protein
VTFLCHDSRQAIPPGHRPPIERLKSPPEPSSPSETAIRACLDAVNADPKPFRWTRSADAIGAVKRFRLKILDFAFAQAEFHWRGCGNGHLVRVCGWAVSPQEEAGLGRRQSNPPDEKSSLQTRERAVFL